ncbi:caspase-10-like [Pseudophryne corroboree]|uniref:caspase-10-like n=1 Tax=Pseudophryne corroboree TaxID=495146 RepID=UPI003081334A
MDFTTLLYKIDSDLTQEDLESFKFLCAKLLPGKRLVSIKSNLDFFEELQKFSLIDETNYFLLAELLYIIGQHSLLKLLNSSRHQVQEHLQERGKIPLYRRMLFELYENITNDDLKTIIYLLKLPPKFKENKSLLDVLCYLEKKELISENNLVVLEDALRHVAQDLIRTITKYKEELQGMMQTSSLPSEEDFEDLPKPQFPVQVVTAARSSTGMKIPTEDMGALSIGEHMEEVCGMANDEEDRHLTYWVWLRLQLPWTAHAALLVILKEKAHQM